jgi:predicted NBD/HSP70 family sugar kinase
MEWKENFSKLDRSSAATINRLNVLKWIIEKRKVKRMEISKLTKLQTSTLTYIIQDLKALNMVREEALNEGTGGKGVKPNTISLNEDDNFVLGFDIRPRDIRVIVKNLADRIIHSEKRPLPFNARTVVEDICGIVADVKKSIKGKKFLGLGVGLPGVVNTDTRRVQLSNLLNLRDFPLGEMLEKRLKLPVQIENNANLAAYGEYVLNYKNKTQNLFYLLFHLDESNNIRKTGIGSGIIINREIYHGDYFAAGEMGDIFDNILSSISSGKQPRFLSRSLLHLLRSSGTSGHSRLLLSLGFKIGEVISQVINIINPSMVVIGDDDFIKGTDFFKSIKEGIRHNLVSFIRDNIQITASGFAGNNVAIGAACLCSKKILSYEYFHELMRLKNRD